MGRLKRIVKIVIVVCVLAAISSVCVFLYVNCYFPFSSATDDYAFLSTSFGMSVPEAKRSLRKHGAVLTDFETYKSMEAGVLIFSPSSLGAIPLYSEDRTNNSNFTLYMPSIKMFNAVTQAEFEFRNKRLENVGVHFQSESLSDSPSLVENLRQQLQKRYKYISREESAEVPGAYTVMFSKGKVNAEMWVNLIDMKKPIVSVWLLYIPTKTIDAARIESREEDAF